MNAERDNRSPVSGPPGGSPTPDEIIDLDTRVLICGSRDWTDRAIVGVVLDGFRETAVLGMGDLVVIEGCARGADSFACHYFDGPCNAPGGGSHGAHEHVHHEHYPADWERHGKAAGPIRNRQMLKEGRPHIVVAFSDDIANSKGTRDMVTIAKAAGVPTYVVSHG